MRLFYTRAFEKKFLKYDKKLQQRVLNAIKILPDGDVKKIVGKNTPVIYRLRVSKYRVLFQMDEEVIKLLNIDSRGDVYKK